MSDADSFFDTSVLLYLLAADARQGRPRCKTLYSEDLQHRQTIDSQLTVINPFAKTRA